MAGNLNLEFVFNPESVAVAGVSLSKGYDGMAETYVKPCWSANSMVRFIPLTQKAVSLKA